MKMKKDVKAGGMNVQIMIAICIAKDIWFKHKQELVITELTGGKHGRASLHYVGNAVDFRTRYFTNEEKEAVAAELTSALSDEYDVIVEETHIHVEWQPK